MWYPWSIKKKINFLLQHVLLQAIVCDSWLLDSRCTNHMTNDHKLFKEVEKNRCFESKNWKWWFQLSQGKLDCCYWKLIWYVIYLWMFYLFLTLIKICLVFHNLLKRASKTYLQTMFAWSKVLKAEMYLKLKQELNVML